MRPRPLSSGCISQRKDCEVYQPVTSRNSAALPVASPLLSRVGSCPGSCYSAPNICSEAPIAHQRPMGGGTIGLSNAGLKAVRCEAIGCRSDPWNFGIFGSWIFLNQVIRRARRVARPLWGWRVARTPSGEALPRLSSAMPSFTNPATSSCLRCFAHTILLEAHPLLVAHARAPHKAP